MSPGPLATSLSDPGSLSAPSPGTVGRWRGRFARRGFDGLHDEPRPGKLRTISDGQVERVVVKTLEEQPVGATHWSTRSMAASTAMSQSAVSRIWRAFGLKPHQAEAFKLSPDPQFIDKVRDIVGLYLNPPEAAVVLCVDEKAQIQALERSAPILLLMPGVAERRSHDYVRNGTTNLYAALDVACGKVIAEMSPRHRAEEFRRFLNLLDASVPARLEVHLVLDNSSTHETPSIIAGCFATRGSRSTSPRPTAPVSTSSRAGSPSSPRSGSNEKATAPCASSSLPSAAGSPTGTTTPTRSSGTRPPTRSSTASQPTASRLTTQDTSASADASSSPARRSSLNDKRTNMKREEER